MPNSSNPYHLWLGLPPDLTSPNYYQLLGIEPTLRDKKAIGVAAKKQLARLKQVDPGKHQAVLEKLKKRVIDAHGVLTNDDKRTAYDQKLLAALTREREETSAVGDATETPAGSSVNHPVPAAPPQAPPATPSSSIPMAVPLERDEVPVVGPDSQNESVVSVGVKPRKHLKKRKRSPVLPIAGGILFLVAIIGAGYFFMNMEQLVGGSNNENQKKPITAEEVAKELAKQNSRQEPKPKENLQEQAPPPKPLNTDPDKRQTSLKDDSNRGPSEEEPDQRWVNTEPLSFNDLVRLRRHLTNAQRAMLRRDKMTADNELANAQSLFLRFNDDPDLAIEPDQQHLERMVDHSLNVKQLLEGFWRQVLDSITQIPGGQSIEVGGQILAFVEGQVDTQPQYVILRIGGQNVRYSIENLPAGIAKALAEQGAKPDLPTWRLQRAAFYAVHASQNPRYKELAQESAAKAVADGHSDQPIAEYVAFDFHSFGVPEQKVDLPQQDAAQDEMNELVRRLGVNGIRSMRPEQALPMVDSLINDSIATDDPSKRAIRLMAAYHAARQSWDTFVVTDAIDELGLWANIDQEQMLINALVQIGKNATKLTPVQARRFCETVIGFARDSTDRSVTGPLINRAKKAADQHQMLDIQRRLEQLD